jgi:hypothetical protein
MEMAEHQGTSRKASAVAVNNAPITEHDAVRANGRAEFIFINTAVVVAGHETGDFHVHGAEPDNQLRQKREASTVFDHVAGDDESVHALGRHEG